MTKFKIIGLCFILTTGLCFISYVGLMTYQSLKPKPTITNPVVKYQLTPNDVKLTDDGIPLRDDLKESSAQRDVKELNDEIVKLKNNYPKYVQDNNLCLQLSQVSALAGLPISYTKLEKSQKYQDLAKIYTKIEQDSNILWSACRFNLLDKSNLGDNTKLYQDYLNTLKIIYL